MIGPEENMLKISWQPEVINSRRMLKLQKTLAFVWQTFKITLFYLNCYKSLLFIAYFSMSTLSVTICSTRNAKWFEKIKNYFFGNVFQKITTRGQKVTFNPMYLKTWAVFTWKGFCDTEVLRNIVYRSQTLVLHFLSLSFHVTLFTVPFTPGQNVSQ